MGPSPFPAIPPVPGVDNAEDQLMRLRQVARDNPDWLIGYESQTDSWNVRKIRRDGTEDHYRKNLSEALDLVEELAAKEKAKEEKS